MSNTKIRNPIYTPKGKALEYAHLALNLYTGCDNGCSYCYAPNMLHKSREDFQKVEPRREILDALQKQLYDWTSIKTGAGMSHSRVLLCFTCDPYPSIDTSTTREAIRILGHHRIPFTILTKSGLRAVPDKDLYSSNDAFGTTLTFVNGDDSKKWEPNAASPMERISTLRTFHDDGIHTWVSLEPVIDPEQTLELVRATYKDVDHYNVGKLNYAKADIDWRLFGIRIIKTLEQQVLMV